MWWFPKAAEAYLADAKGRYFSAATIKNKRNFLGRLRAFLNNRELNEQTAREYCAHIPDKGWKVRSAYGETVQLRTFLKFCYEQKYITKYFIDKIKKPKLDGEEPQIPMVSMEIAEKAILWGTETRKQENHLAHQVKSDMRIALLLILYTGLRFAEVKRLRGSDLFLDTAPPYLLALLKGRKQKEQIYLPKGMVNLLQPIVQRDTIFHICDAGCNRAINRGLQRLGIRFKVTCHGLRHIVGNEENRQGMPAFYLQRHMNHRKFETTQKYYLQNNLGDLARNVDLYNPLARRALTTTDKLNALYDQIRRWIGQDDALVAEQRENEILVQIK